MIRDCAIGVTFCCMSALALRWISDFLLFPTMFYSCSAFGSEKSDTLKACQGLEFLAQEDEG
jgi:hypothetical protein